MPSENQNNKLYAILLVVIIIAFAWYFFFREKPSQDLALLELESGPSSATTFEILSTLNQVRNLKIDSEFFRSQAYQSLVDYNVEIIPQPIGRQNPFAPIGGR